jgi:O-antigen/teichoic acid export membrane protein
VPSKFKVKSEFSRNVLTLMTGTTIAQAIPIAISPILTRVYSPQDFGLFALYMSVVSIMSVVVTGRYELAIMLPKKEEDAKSILHISLLITLLISVATLALVSLFNVQIASLLGNEDIADWLYFIPLSLLLVGFYQTFTYWINRRREYKKLSISRISQSTTTAGTNILMGLNNFQFFGLILGTILGQAVSLFILSKSMLSSKRSCFFSFDWSALVHFLKKFKKFPLMDIPASLLNVSSQQSTYIFFNALFSSATAGQYFLVVKTLNIPLVVVSSSIRDVFKERASYEYSHGKGLKQIYLSTLKKLVYISIIPFSIVAYFILDIFTFIFGQNWAIAGEFAQILMPMVFMRFVISPLTYIYFIVERQYINLGSQIILMLSTLLSFYIGYIYNDAFYTVYSLCILYFLIYLANGLILYYIVKRENL